MNTVTEIAADLGAYLTLELCSSISDTEPAREQGFHGGEFGGGSSRGSGAGLGR